MRTRDAHRLIGWRAMKINIAPLGIDISATIEAPLQTTQPQDTRQDPVTFRVGRRQFCIVILSGRPAPTEYRTRRQPLTNGGTNIVPAKRRTATSFLLTGTGQCSGNRPLSAAFLSAPVHQPLSGHVDFKPAPPWWWQRL